MIEKAGIGAESHYRVRFVMLQQGPTSLLVEADETDIACPGDGRTRFFARGENRVYPSASHDKIELAELAPDLIRQRPASCIARHDCLPVRGRTIVPRV
ncbi:hypothetical protein ASD64_13895 [Mesorhizobium sp. Root157]|nr:hypothetical protein ASD64_13895 [Mesorhizobium sp. Root157]